MTLETLDSEEKKVETGRVVDFPVSPEILNQCARRKWRATRKPQRGFGLVEKMFYYYDRIKREVEICRDEQGYYQSGGKTGGGSSTRAFISDPTATIAMKHYQPLAKVIINAERLDEEVIAQPEKWLTVVEQTLFFFSDNEDELVSEVLRRRFFENEPMRKTQLDLEIGVEKYYRLRDVGIGYARECAIQLGLIKVF
mgnify:FL=1